MMLSEQIKRGRNALGMSQADLAEANSGLSQHRVQLGDRRDDARYTEPGPHERPLRGLRRRDGQGNDKVMAQAVARDRRHILLAGPLMQSDPESAEPKLSLFDLNAIGSSVYGKFESTDITDAGALAFRLVRVASFFSRSLYFIVDENGRRVGSIARKRALYRPVYQVRIEGFKRVQLSQEVRMDNGFKDVIRFEGEGITVSGNLMGDDFAIQREGTRIASVHVRPANNRVAYGIELANDETRPTRARHRPHHHDAAQLRPSVGSRLSRRKMPSR